jgi:hypothetical protein
MVTPIWRARLFRVWLVIGVPLACWTAYEAWDAYQKIDFWKNRLEEFKAHPELEGFFSFPTAMGQHNRSIEKANLFTLLTVMLLALPILGVIILKILEWVWSGSPATAAKDEGSQVISSRSWRNLISSKRASWGMGIGGLLVFTGIMYSLNPESTTTTLIQVFVQVGVLGAVLALIKFFRR